MNKEGLIIMNSKAFTRKHVTIAALAVSAAVALPLLACCIEVPVALTAAWLPERYSRAQPRPALFGSLLT